jgi:hypothetical protein
MTLADAGADAGPLWLRITIALGPPALAALIAGYFALSNTVSRRIERLKDLNDIRVSSNTDFINPDYALERIMLRELRDLDRATTPILKWRRRFSIGMVTIIWIIYQYAILVYLHAVTEPRPQLHNKPCR